MVTKKSLKAEANKIIEKEKIELSCDCGHKFKETIGRLKNNPTLTCRSCDTIISIDGDSLRALLND